MRLTARDAARLGLPAADAIPEPLRGAYADLERRKGVNARCDALGVERPADFVARKQSEFEARVAGIVEEGARRIAEVEARTWRFTVEGVQGKGRPRLGKGRAFTPKATRDYEAKVARAVREAGVAAGAGPCSVRLYVWTATRRRLDLDNVLKAIVDGLVAGGGVDDDACTVVTEMSATWHGVDKANPRVTVEVVLR